MNKTTDKKAAMFFANGCEEIEGLTVYDLLYRAGIECTKVSVTGSDEVVSSHELTFKCDTKIEDLNFDEYDMLILPGGMPGTVNLRSCELLCEKVKEFASSGKYVAAICAAPTIFAELGLLQGKKAVSNPGFEGKMLENGVELIREPVCQTGNIITSRAMGTSVPFGLKIVEVFLGEKTAMDLKEKILFA